MRLAPIAPMVFLQELAARISVFTAPSTLDISRSAPQGQTARHGCSPPRANTHERARHRQPNALSHRTSFSAIRGCELWQAPQHKRVATKSKLAAGAPRDVAYDSSRRHATRLYYEKGGTPPLQLGSIRAATAREDGF